MESIKYLKNIAVICFGLVVLFTMEYFFPLRNGGLYVGFFELLVESWCFVSILKNKKLYADVLPAATVYLKTFFGSLFIADFCYIALFYASSHHYNIWWTSIPTTFLYAVAFLAAALAMCFSFDRMSLKEVFWRPLVLLPIVLFFPIALRFILLPYIYSLEVREFSTQLLGQGIVILSSFFALTMGLLVLLSSRGIFWSSFSLGIVTLIFGDWALRVEVFNGKSPAFGFYEYFWALGVFMSAIPLLSFYRNLRKIDAFDLRSLLCSYKVGTITLSLVLIAFLCLSQYGSLSAIKIISLGSSFGAIVATVVSHFLTERVHYFSKQLGILIEKQISDEIQAQSPHLLPLELSDSFELILKRKIQELKEYKLREISAQVAHDIRSPLAAVITLESDLSALPEDKRLMLRSALNRIKDIANSLLDAEQNRQVNYSVYLISSIIDQLITEKRLQYRSKLSIEIEVKMEATSYGLFAKVQVSEFKRVLSNLINNSIESIDGKGCVTVVLEAVCEFVQIKICDNGHGIDPEILPKLMNKGETHGKKGGLGLGLFHAKTTIESWGGSLSILSRLGKGTEISIFLPKAESPTWFMPMLTISPCSRIVILDDDSSIHQFWDQRLDAMGLDQHQVDVFHFSTPNEVEQWVKDSELNQDEVLYLFDYELLGEKLNGLQLIEKLGIQSESVLVTSRYEESSIRKQCDRLGVKLIPKGMAGFIPIQIRESLLKPLIKSLIKVDAVLLDDDELVHMSWGNVARINQKKLLSFYEPQAFFDEIVKLDRTTPLFVDSHLKNQVKGEQLVGQILDLGFREIYISTGYEKERLARVQGITGVIGKEVPSALVS